MTDGVPASVRRASGPGIADTWGLDAQNSGGADESTALTEIGLSLMSIETFPAERDDAEREDAKPDDAKPGDAAANSAAEPALEERWDRLSQRLCQLNHPKYARKMFGDSSERGNVYRWGVAASLGQACDPLTVVLSRLGCADSKVCVKSIDLDRAAASFIELIDGMKNVKLADAHQAILWAAALPALADRIEPHRWWRLTSTLQQLHEAMLQRNSVDSCTHLMLAGELGLTLAWRVRCVAACQQLANRAAESVRRWCERETEAVSVVLAHAGDTRLVLGSLLRCQALVERVAKRKFRKADRRTAALLANWAAVFTHPSGTAFSDATVMEMEDDYTDAGLIPRLMDEHAEALGPAFAAACGEAPVGGRLAWEVGLPKSFHHDREAKLAVAFPEWDVRRGRFHLDYSREDPWLELFAGRRKVFAGKIQVRLELDGTEQHPCGDWSEVCEYSDDDVHYLEIEQHWTGGITVQRQLMLIRDDRCLLLADSLVPENVEEVTESTLDYWINLPLDPSISWRPDSETREGFLADEKQRVLVVPLAAGEWSMGPTDSTISETADRHLQLYTRGRHSLYAPLWFDFQRRRFSRPRTWRQLTVGDQLRLVSRHEAIAYRVQAGSEQWMVYRSLGQRRCRTTLGKHLIAGFYGSRFYPGDGSHEELVTVDESYLTDD
jgi:hypothetical protein